MRRYETVVIVPADLPDDDIAVLIDRYKSIIAGQKGLVMKVEKWGKRKLAYEIRKSTRGFYLLIDFAGLSAVVAELERNLKIDDKVLKFLTVKKDDKVNLEDLQKELEAASASSTASEGSKDAEPLRQILPEDAKPVEAKTEETQGGGE